MPIPSSEYRSQREGLSPSEKGKQDRRIARAIKDGVPLGRLMKTHAVTEARIRAIAAEYGCALVRGKPGGGSHRW